MTTISRIILNLAKERHFRFAIAEYCVVFSVLRGQCPAIPM